MGQRLTEDDDVNLREYLDVLRRHWKIIAYFAVGLAVLLLILSLLQKPAYEAKATILVKTGPGNSAAAQFAGLAGLAGVNLSAGSNSLGDLTEVLQSQAVAARVASDLNLRARIKGWNNPHFTDAQIALMVKGMLRRPVVAGNLITLKAENTDPVLAADIANEFVNALSYYWNALNYTEARNKRKYIESQMPRVEKDLKTAEQKLKKFTLLSSGNSNAPGGISGLLSSSKSEGVDVARHMRELEIQNSVYTMLRKEYEAVKLDEAKEIPPFSVVDAATIPLKPSKPSIKRNVLLGLLVGLGIGIFAAYLKEYWEKA